MKKYYEIELTDEEKKILEYFKSQEYTEIFRKNESNRIAFYDGSTGTEYITSIRNMFLFIDSDNDEAYEIDKLLNPPHEPKTVWELEEGDEYWSVSAAGIVYKDTWNNGCPDIDCRSQGNVFLTREEAEFERKRREVVAMVMKYARPFIHGKDNWCSYYDHGNGVIRFTNNNRFEMPCSHFCSKTDIRKAIDEVGEDDFIKYYLGVTN